MNRDRDGSNLSSFVNIWWSISCSSLNEFEASRRIIWTSWHLNPIKALASGTFEGILLGTKLKNVIFSPVTGASSKSLDSRYAGYWNRSIDYFTTTKFRKNWSYWSINQPSFDDLQNIEGTYLQYKVNCDKKLNAFWLELAYLKCWQHFCDLHIQIHTPRYLKQSRQSQEFLQIWNTYGLKRKINFFLFSRTDLWQNHILTSLFRKQQRGLKKLWRWQRN